MKSIKQMLEILRNLGLKRLYRPQCEPETDTILIKTRKPAKITDGKLSGCEIALCGSAASGGSEFKVWTSQKQKAKTTAVEHGLKVRLMDGEAELMVPASLADLILPMFGAKVRRELSPEQLTIARLRAQHARQSLNLRKISIKNEVLGMEQVKVGVGAGGGVVKDQKPPFYQGMDAAK